MNFPHEIFKAYDIRGIVNCSLTPEIVVNIGKALGSKIVSQSADPAVVGWDGRLTSSKLAGLLCRGLLSTGCDVIEIGQVPTPTLYYAATQFGSGTGIQITGSHNPPQYNGFKMMVNGRTLHGDEIQDIKHHILHDEHITGAGKFTQQNKLSDYCQAIIDDIHLRRPFKLVVDCGNGVAGSVAPEIYRRLGCEVIELFCEIDGNFPNHHPDPSQLENLQDLIAAVERHNADFGLAFDGDGDRLGVVSGDGQVVWPDRLMVLFSQAILKVTPGAEIIFDVKCSQVLPKAITEGGGVPRMWKTGHSFIKERLKETGVPLAGEMSGHIFFNDRWGGFDDGIYSGARLCELLSGETATPADVFSGIPDRVNTPELRLELPEGEHYQLVKELISTASFKDAAVSTLDGIRVDFDDGFGLVRASNTTPTVIMRFEAGDEFRLQHIMERFRRLLLETRPDLKLPF